MRHFDLLIVRDDAHYFFFPSLAIGYAVLLKCRQNNFSFWIDSIIGLLYSIVLF